MSESLIITLDALQPTDRHRVGGKAMTLGELLAAGFPVPAGLCITTDAFHRGLADYQASIQAILQQHDLRDLAAAQAAATTIAQLLAELVIPAPVIDALQSQLLHIAEPTTPLAVRSSATAEDQVEPAMPGNIRRSSASKAWRRWRRPFSPVGALFLAPMPW